MRQVDYLAELSLASGRVICLDRYEMSKTYAGLMEGVPTEEHNDELLRALGENLAERFGRPVHVIDPPRQEHEMPGSATHPPRRWQLLPGVLCVGVFDSDPIDGELDPDFAWSSLVIAWFQNEPQFPVGSDAMPALAAVAWEAHAVECEY
jgi:hypothetical protein